MTDFVPYMQRTRDYYRAQGYPKDYVWAQHDDVPFHPLAKPLADCRVTIVTTAVPDPRLHKSVRRAESLLFSAAPAAFDTKDQAWDRENTHTNDRHSYFPYEALRSLAEEGVIGALTERFHHVPTHYSQRLTIEEDAPQVADACVQDEVDIALLCPL